VRGEEKGTGRCVTNTHLPAFFSRRGLHGREGGDVNAIILAAGFGTRLSHLGYPKAFARLGKSTAINRAVDAVNVAGVKAVHVAISGRWAGEFYRWREGVLASAEPGRPGTIPYLRLHNDGALTAEERLGAVGSLEFVLGRLGNARAFLLLPVDTVLAKRVDAFLARSMGEASDCPWVEVRSVSGADAAELGKVECSEDGRVLRVRKDSPSSLAWLGPAWFPPSVVPLVSEYCAGCRAGGTLPDDLGAFIEWLAARRPVMVAPASGDERCFEIGTPRGLEVAQAWFGNGRR
jgi:glucose-1-phosphate thymidylyltransferase